jgi:hypothetical protein
VGTAALTLAGATAFIGVRYANTAQRIPSRFSSDPPQLVDPPLKSAVLTGEDANAVRIVAARFIDTAVLRQHIDESWEITAPKLRQGFTRKQWQTGNIPVQPFPAEAVSGIKYRIDFSATDHIYLKVAIIPKATADVGGQAFDMGLRRKGAVADHHWLVDYFVPTGLGQPSPVAQRAAAKLPPPKLESRIPVAWIFAPIGIFGAFIVGIPLALAVRGWRRSVRANRAYRAS